MKPFNLEEAKAGKPVVTRSGRPVRIGLFDRKHRTFPIIGVVLQQDDMEAPFQWKNTGAWYSENESSALDLFMATEKKTGWVIIRKNDREVKCSGTIFHNIHDAIRLCEPEKEVVVEIEWEE